MYTNNITKQDQEILVSIIVPIYNIGTYLKDLIESVNQQTLKGIELVLIDDCSDDDPLSIINNTKNLNIKINYIRHQINQGPGAARNTGIKAAHGKYVFFADPDDCLFNKTNLEKIIQISDNYDVIVGNAVLFFDNPKHWTYRWEGSFFSNKTYASSKPLYIDMWQCLIKLSFIKQNKISFTNSRRGQDIIFIFDVMLQKPSILVTHYSLYRYRAMHRYFNYTQDNLKSILPFYNEYLYKLSKIYPGSYELSQTNSSIFPNFITWCAPIINLDAKLTSKYYDITQSKAQQLINDYYQVTSKFSTKRSLFAYSINTLSFTKNKTNRIKFFEQKFRLFNYTFTKIIKPKAIRLKFLDCIKYVHLCSYTKDYSYIIKHINSTQNPKEHLFIFVRSGDTIVYKHINPAPKAINVIEDVSLLGLDLIFKYLHHLNKIFVYTFSNMPIFIFLNKKRELLHKTSLFLTKLPSIDIIEQRSELDYCYKAINIVYLPSSCQDNEINKSIISYNLEQIYNKKISLEENADIILILSDSFTFVSSALLDCLKTYKNYKIYCQFDSFSPKENQALANNYKFSVNFIKYSTSKLMELIPKVKTLYYNYTNEPKDEIYILCSKVQIKIITNIDC